MNPKIERTMQEIDKVKAKIVELQTRLRELEQQKTEQENAEIVAAVRGVRATPEELAAMLLQLRGGASQAPAPAPVSPNHQSIQEDEDEK